MRNRLLILLAVFTLSETALTRAGDLPLGSLDPSFGDNGIVRLFYETRPGSNGLDDFGKSIKIVYGGFPIFGPQYLLVAGKAGKRIQITKLTMDGVLGSNFGDNGVVFSTRTNVDSFAGMELMPNGDIVIGYADDYVGPNADSKDFFIEVFEANGVPKNIGGPEVFNQRWVDLSNDFAFCDAEYRKATARQLLRTADGTVVVVGNQAITDGDGNFVRNEIDFAEFDGNSYAPVFAPEPFYCFSAGGQSKYPWDQFTSKYIDGNDAWSAISHEQRNVIAVGNVRGAEGDFPASMNNRDLSTSNFFEVYTFDLVLPLGFWRNRSSIFKQIRSENINQFKLFGSGENGVFTGQNRLQPIIATAAENSLQPNWFPGLGAATSTSIDITDGHVLSDERLLVVGSAHGCNASSCFGPTNSLVLGVSNGQLLLNNWLPENTFGNEGWVRHNVPDYSGFPTGESMSAESVLSRPLASTTELSLYVVGWFRNYQLNDIDTYVAKIRVRNSTTTWLTNYLFDNGFE